ncbi:MAG TPA: TetR/AcrR family transcriptional regulator [Solirubrobacterales bacterium]|jgi:AcrR family transcriptional regulator
MTRLELVTDEAAEGPFSAGKPLPRRLPPGRHGIPANLVVEHQRRRLLTAMAEAFAEHGYAGVTTTQVSELANVSTSTFYKHFGNLWDCVLAAYVAGADELCEEIDAACAARDPRLAPLEVGVDAALAFLSAEPSLAQLLCAQAPREAVAVTAARRLLVSRLAAMLRRDRGSDVLPAHPPGLDERLIDATLAFVCTRICTGEASRLIDLGPELTAILDRPRRAA